MSGIVNIITHGSCLCGAVQYEITAPPSNRGACHCFNCKKWTGSPFATNWWYPRDHFRVTAGPANLCSYVSSTTDEGRTVERFSCATCSSPLYITIANRPTIIIVAAGSLDRGPHEAPKNEYFTRDREEWMSAVDKAIQNYD